MASKKTREANEGGVPLPLPKVGLSRYAQIDPFLPFGRETWRKLCAEGKAPRPIKMTLRCTVWQNEEIHRFLADPVNYRAEPQGAA